MKRICFFVVFCTLIGCESNDPHSKIINCDDRIANSLQKQEFTPILTIIDECADQFPKDHPYQVTLTNQKIGILDRIGKMSLEAGDLSGATMCFKEEIDLIKGDPDQLSTAWLHLSATQFAAGDHDQVIVSAQKSLEISDDDNKDILALTFLAKSYSAKGDVKKTEETIERLEAIKKQKR